MTCIVGVQTETSVVIGGDSAGVAGWVVTHRGDPKVFHNGAYLIGFTTSFRMGQLLRFAKLPTPGDKTGVDLDRFMSGEFVDAVRKVLKDGGFAKKESEQEEGGTFLVGVSGRLYCIGGDYQVGWSRDGYGACGSGWEVAYGALYSNADLPAAVRVKLALEAAEHHSGGVQGPFTILTQVAT